VNFLEFDGTNFVFELGRREKRLLLEVLKYYPLIPSSHHKMSGWSDEAAMKATQKLLDEALAERKQEAKKQLQTLLDDAARFKETESGFHFVLNPQQAECLLEVFNDIRVGSWLILGEPNEKKGKPVNLTDANSQFLWTMEISGHYEAALLEAFDQRGRT
jgi:hypothetical protein